jgi:cell division inhibitor SulA
MKPALAELLHNPHLWHGDSLARTDDVIGSGFPALDAELPGGGWPQGTLTELIFDEGGIGELRLLMPALKRLAQGGEAIVLAGPPHIPYAPAFAGCGIDPGRVIVIDAEGRDCWWAAEQALRSNSAGALLFWPRSLSDQRERRLQLAAQEGAALAFFFTGTTRASQPSPAPLRIRLSRAANHLHIDVFKRRGGVMNKPLLLDVSVVYPSAARHVPATGVVRAQPLSDRLRAGRSPSSHRQHPVGGPYALVWNRALARADEMRRVPRPDPREEGGSRNERASAVSSASTSVSISCL